MAASSPYFVGSISVLHGGEDNREPEWRTSRKMRSAQWQWGWLSLGSRQQRLPRVLSDEPRELHDCESPLHARTSELCWELHFLDGGKELKHSASARATAVTGWGLGGRQGQTAHAPSCGTCT